jgi:dTDP-4-amino-4,6-dideoxygalactose transaminase
VIRLSPPQLTGDELDSIASALGTGWAGPGGEVVAEFERSIARRCGAPHALATTSGTSALHLALLAAGVEPGNRVWCSTLTFIATANAIRYVGAEPVFVDCDESWQIDADLVEEGLALAARTGTLPKAIVAVHLYGEPFFGELIAEACERHGVVLIEDACQALGTPGAGSFGDFAAVSFNSNKIITTGGGGMLLAKSMEGIGRARMFAAQSGPTDGEMRQVEYSRIGFNYRMGNVTAAIGLAQLGDLDRRVAARRAIRREYENRYPGAWQPHATGNGWLSAIQIPWRDAAIGRLAEARIESRPVFLPMHLQPLYRRAGRIRGARAEQIAREGLCLPSAPGTDVAAVVEALR